MITTEPIYFPESEWKRPMIVAGPCSAESEEQVMTTANALSAIGVKLFRAGIWKPRTKPGCFEGVGSVGLAWLQRVQRETGMRVMIEVANAKHVEEALKAGIDYLWIGARTTVNPFAVQEVADALHGVNIPVFVKNPINPDLELWVGAIERLNLAGITKIATIHRGFSSYEKKIYRNPPQWQIPIEFHRRYPEIPLFCDPSHISGKRELVPQLCQKALDLGFDGLFIESHCSPDSALSDAAQQVTPTTLRDILDYLVVRHEYEQGGILETYRQQIDELDDALIDIILKRMKVSSEIAHIKKERNITVLQTLRYNEIIEKRCSQAVEKGISADCIQKIFEAIHTESVNRQMDIMSSKPE